MKKLLLLSPLVLTGCWLTEKIVESEEVLNKVVETANDVGGPYGALLGLGITSVVGAAKWWEHKAKARDVIAAVQKSKDELPQDAKDILKKALNTHTPSVVKKYIAKVKQKL